MENAIKIQQMEMSSILKLMKMTTDKKLIRLCIKRYKLLSSQLEIYYELKQEGKI